MTGRAAAVIAGGVGAARFLVGLLEVCEPEDVTAIVNVGDDFTLCGLHISPDLDTVAYTLAGQVNPETGWGRADETWQVLGELGRLGGPDWFKLGDLDLGLHLYRTQRLAEGASLSQVTAEVAARFDLGLQLLPVSDDPIRTRITPATPLSTREPAPSTPSAETSQSNKPATQILDRWKAPSTRSAETSQSAPTGDTANPNEAASAGHGAAPEIDFQEYFVAHRHAIAVRAVRFAGIDRARPAPGVLEALERAAVIVIAPSNPIVSVGPVIGLDAVGAALRAKRDQVVAVSPIVGGRAIKGPAADLMGYLGHDASAVGVARLYAPYAATLLIDHADRALAAEVEAAQVTPIVTDTIMADSKRSAALARRVLQAGGVHP